MTKPRTETPALRVPWGSFALDGTWHPNQHLAMSADEQRRRNVANGFLPEALRISVNKKESTDHD